MQAVLVAINDMLASNPIASIPLFHSLASKDNPDDPYGPIVKCLAMEEELVILASLRILGVLIAFVGFSSITALADWGPSTDSRSFPYNLTGTLLASLQGLLNGSRQPLWEVAAQVLGAVLGTKQFRLAIWEEEQCISG